MKTLSIKQPWASLIAHGVKDIENRTWKTNFRGRIYIHASGSIVNEIDFTTQQTAELFENGIWHPDSGFTSELNITSAIIGEVDIVDCVINHESIWAESNGFVEKPLEKDFLYEDGELNHIDYSAEYSKWKHQNGKPIYNWVLANAVLYDEPILNVKGKLSLWEFIR